MDSTILELHIGLPWKDMQFEQNDYYLKGYLIRVIGCRFMDKILYVSFEKTFFYQNNKFKYCYSWTYSAQ